MNSTDNHAPLIPVILSGGAGTRLWPVSRRAHPKPFMKLADGQTLAEKTWLRARAIAGRAPVLTVTSRDYYFYTRDLYGKEMEESRQALFILEPLGRNTAPAIALAAMYVRENLGADACLLIMPADHLVTDLRNFKACVDEARYLASQDMVVTFGIHPTHAETGYGYIRKGEPLTASGGHRIDAFVEKPNIETAKEYLESGDYLWNSGMFCFKAGTILEALGTHSPQVYDSVSRVWRNMDTAESPLEIPAELFKECPSISIDYAVMERAENSAVVVSDFGWSDIGSWKAISELYESDDAGNRLSGKVVMVDSRNCFVQSDRRLVAVVGVDDLVIVDTGDAVLVAHRDHVQDVKEVVRQLTDLEDDAAIFHTTVHRPWGSYTILEDEDDCKVKRLTVKPGQVLSLQLHHRRSEHWTVVSGTAKVRVGDKEIMLEQNQSIYIPVETLHRLENPGDEDIHLIEVQTGDYFGEDDIERFEDIYGRS